MFAKDLLVGRGRPAALLLLLLCCAPALADSGGYFRAENADIVNRDGEYRLDVVFAIDLGEGAGEALENNVPLVFEIQVQLVRKNRWLWDSIDNEIRHVHMLQYHALSRRYIVSGTDGSGRSSYRNLDEALAMVGSLNNILLARDDEIDADGKYEIRLRGSLDIESLPTPVRLLAYASPAWEMQSEWYTWPLRH